MAFKPLAGADNYHDVVIVGAGISGINFGYRLKERNPDLSYTILEGRHEIGGTWSLFKYPGIRSDSDLFTFGFAWRPWNEPKSIAEGPSIRNYLKDSAVEQGIDKKIKFNTLVDTADWSPQDKAWTLHTTSNGAPVKYTCRFLLLGTGYYDYNEPLKAPIPGIDNFQGRVIHPQFWPEDLDYTNKEVVVVGSGATAVTVLPVMAKTAKHVTMLQRSPGYVVSIPTQDGFEWFFRKFFSWWPSLMAFLFRAKWILASLFITTLSAKFPKFAQKAIFRRMDSLLPESVPRDPHFTPSYYPWQQRMCLCPDGDFFDGLKSGKASVETGVIKTVTSNSIQLASGKELHPDIIITATGLKLKFAGGIKLTINGTPYNIPEKFIWKGLMLEDLPNVSFSFGYVDASWTLGADATAQLISRMLNTMKKEGVDVIVPTRSDLERTSMKERALLSINSTYVTKAAAVLPKAGTTGPWTPRTHFFRDIWYAWYGNIHLGMDWIKVGEKASS